MKKLLTILALALALCLLCGAAMAETVTDVAQKDAWKRHSNKFGDAFTDGAASLLAAAEADHYLIGGIDVDEDSAEIQRKLTAALTRTTDPIAIHAEYSEITLSGTKYKVNENKLYKKVSELSEEEATVNNGLFVVDKDNSTEAETKYRAYKDDDDAAELYALILTYDYVDQGWDEVTVLVSLKPHDKLGEATVSGDKITYTCSICGKAWEAVDKPDPAKCSHIWAWEYVEGKEPTCLAGGREILTCTLCGTTTGNDRECGPIDHTWEYEKDTVVAPVCRAASTAAQGANTHAGSVYKHCTVCGAREKEDLYEGSYRQFMVKDLGKTVEEANAFSIHKWSSKAVVPATCDRVAYYQQICERCHAIRSAGNVLGSKALEANYVAVDVPNCNTVKDDSVITFKCTNCSSASRNHPALKVTVAELKAEYGIADDVTIADLLKTSQFVTFNTERRFVYYGYWRWVYNDSRLAGDEWIEEFYVADGSELVNLTVTIGHGGKLEATKDAKEFARDQFTNEKKKVEEALCDDPVFLAHTCELCKEKGIEVKMRKIEHKWGAWKAILETETITKYARQCAICGDQEISFGTTAPDKKCKEGEHNYVAVREGEWVNCANTRVDVALDAKTPVRCVGVCTICGDQIDDFYAVVEHEWEEVPGLAKAGSCTVKASKTYQCKVCDAIIVEELDFVHDWDAGKITKKATKTADGVKTFTCKKCGATKEEAVKYELAAAKYTVKATYSNGVLKGKLTHVEDTKEAEKKFVRVTFFVGTYYMTVSAEVAADGSFEVEGVGPIDYITVVPTGNSAVKPDEVKRIGDAIEIFVK